MPGWTSFPAEADYRGFTHRQQNYRGFTHSPESPSGRRRAVLDGERSFRLWTTDLGTRFSGTSDSGFHPPHYRGFTHRITGFHSPTALVSY